MMNLQKILVPIGRRSNGWINQEGGVTDGTRRGSGGRRRERDLGCIPQLPTANPRWKFIVHTKVLQLFASNSLVSLPLI